MPPKPVNSANPQLGLFFCFLGGRSLGSLGSRRLEELLELEDAGMPRLAAPDFGLFEGRPRKKRRKTWDKEQPTCLGNSHPGILFCESPAGFSGELLNLMKGNLVWLTVFCCPIWTPHGSRTICPFQLDEAPEKPSLGSVPMQSQLGAQNQLTFGTNMVTQIYIQGLLL